MSKRKSPNELKVERQRKREAENPEKYKAKRLEQYSKNKSKIIERTRFRRQQDPAYYLWSKARTRSRKQNIAFDIEPADVVIPKRCPVLGIKIRVLSKDRNSSATIDKIIPSLGYVKGNIAVISRRANEIKTNATFEELWAVTQWLRNKL